MSRYFSHDEAGIDWLLDPSFPGLRKIVKVARGATVDDSCEPDAVVADLTVLKRLLRERHIGLALGFVDDPSHIDDAIDHAIARIQRERPGTRGEALGDVATRLREILADNHFSIVGSSRVETRADESVFVPPADEPAVAEEVINGVLCVRLARLMGGAEDSAVLESFQASAARHFAHDKIILDVRGCPGGNDGYTILWALTATKTGTRIGGSSVSWLVDGKPLNAWNQVAVAEALNGPESVPGFFRDLCPTITPGLSLTVSHDSNEEELGEAATAWGGRMIILTDRKTASSGESTAIALKQLLGARIVGGRSMGCIEYGNLNAFVLPHTPLLVSVASLRNTFEVPVEMVGVPVDVDADVTQPLSFFATNFDSFAR